MSKPTQAQYIKADKSLRPPFVLLKANDYRHLGLFEIRGEDGQQYTHWYVSFNGNSKQRRQQQRKLIRELNQ